METGVRKQAEEAIARYDQIRVDQDNGLSVDYSDVVPLLTEIGESLLLDWMGLVLSEGERGCVEVYLRSIETKPQLFQNAKRGCW